MATEGELHEAPAEHVEGLLGGPLADAVAVAGEGAFEVVDLVDVGEGEVDEADGFVLGGSGGAPRRLGMAYISHVDRLF